MAWIEPEAISDLIGDTFDEGLIDFTIDHAQALAEIEVGEQEVPLPRGLKAVLTQIVIRMLRSFEEARTNPTGLTQESLGSYSYSISTVAGLGLTNAEKKLLRKAAGLSGIGVLRITRGPLETPGPPGILGPSSIDWFEVEGS